MAHKHSVYDTEPHFQIDKTSREIKNVSNSKTTITQFDHNSERFTFEIPRFIDGHDMSLCNKVQVHYINIDSTDKTNKISGVYTVEDLELSPEDEDIVICSWLISQNATQLAGSLTFLLRFACVTDDVLDYAWNTTKCTTISVSNGLYNGEAIIEEYFDILSVWEQNIIDDVTAGIDETIEEKVDNVKLVESATGSAITIDSANAPIPCLKLFGKTTQDGTPTPTSPIELKSVGDSGSFEVGVYGNNKAYNPTGTGATIDQNGYVIVTNTSQSDWYVNCLIDNPYGEHTISFELENADLFVQFNVNDYSRLFKANGSVTVTPNGWLRIMWVTHGGTTSKVRVMCNVGTEALPYEPPTKQSLIMPYTLEGADGYNTEIDFAKGVKRNKSYTFTVNGGENWIYHETIRGFRFVPYQHYNILPIRGKGMSSHFTEKIDTDLCFFVSGGVQPLNIYDYNGKWGANVSTFKTWLSENNVTFVLPLETPIETPLTETELNAYRQLMTNKGTTTVLSEADVDLLYYVNKPNAQVIGDIHTQINKDYLKLHAMLQSESQSEG